MEQLTSEVKLLREEEDWQTGLWAAETNLLLRALQSSQITTDLAPGCSEAFLSMEPLVSSQQGTRPTSRRPPESDGVDLLEMCTSDQCL
jgi:hypothetical protein